MSHKMLTTVILLAAGKGSRMGADEPKQFLLLDNKPLFMYSLHAFQASPQIDRIVLVTDAAHVETVRRCLDEAMALDKVTAIVPGGAERFASVWEGLKAAGSEGRILIHDSARPFVDEALIGRSIQAADAFGSAAAAVPVTDTVRMVDDCGQVVMTPDRGHLRAIQTPQAFRGALVHEAYRLLMQDATLWPGITDDVMVVEKMLGVTPSLFEGSTDNRKVTTPEDLQWARIHAEESGR